MGTTNDRLANFDFPRHNDEVESMWGAVRSGKPTRIPIILGVSQRYYMFNASANPRGVRFKEYSEDPDLMYDMALAFGRWQRFNLLQDAELGIPKKAWTIAIDFQNYFEAAWFGCPVEFMDDQVPDTRPVFAEQPERVMENGLPDPFGGLMAKVRRYYEHFQQRAAEGYLGRPVEVTHPWCAFGSDGPMTVACNLFSPEFVCTAMAGEEERLQKLLSFITDATIARIRAWRSYAGDPAKQENWGFADDSIAMISTTMYRQHILPHHRRIFDALATPAPRGIHLCGDATRHFVTLRDELNVRSFDTGFPVDFADLRRKLGPDVNIQGGPHIAFLLTATPAEIEREVERIMTSGVLEGGRFVLREGNNLAPHTPIENTEALYHAGRRFGKLTERTS